MPRCRKRGSETIRKNLGKKLISLAFLLFLADFRSNRKENGFFWIEISRRIRICPYVRGLVLRSRDIERENGDDRERFQKKNVPLIHVISIVYSWFEHVLKIISLQFLLKNSGKIELF